MMRTPNSFYSLTVEDVRTETADCKSVQFSVPETYRDLFRALPGQYITLSIVIDGVPARRCYSICEQNDETAFRIAVKKVPSGVCSTFIVDNLNAGDVVDVMPPMGTFTLNSVPDIEKKTPFYVAIAAGSGVTPIMAIIRHLLQSTETARFTLLYQNGDRSGTIFREDLLDLKNRFMERFNLLFVFSREQSESAVTSGRLDNEKLALIYDRFPDFQMASSYFLCGPEGLIDTATTFLKGHGVPENRIINEHFVNQGQHVAQLSSMREENSLRDGECKAEIQLNGTTQTLNLPYGETILNSLLKKGLNAPFACQGGVCSTCKIKVSEGEVSMPVNYSLEKEQLENKIYLSCSSFPVSEFIRITYDI